MEATNFQDLCTMLHKLFERKLIVASFACSVKDGYVFSLYVVDS